MKVILAEPRGFCSGVNRAINILENVVKNAEEPVYVYHEIVHNAWVVGRFRRQGVVFVDSIDAVPDGAILLFSAHGVSPELRKLASERKIKTIDATCPLVHNIHSQVRNYAEEGYKIVFVGKRGHDEVIGTLGEAPDAIVLISSVEDAEALDFPADQKLTFLMQTTLSVIEAAEIVDALRRKFPQLRDPKHEGLCDATQKRQEAVRKLAPEVDVVLVVGSANSSNSKRLAEVARAANVPAYLINGVEDIPWSKLTPESTVLLTAGASAPESVVQACAQFLRDV
ncbi:MAG: 4-hydroxy-3-methylbut-2-enyl diphosphate reductase [Thermoguttaceae bacterium]|nr:4-hydroxy-3-methylbut-2-enyl diphosphate reductase [Thermoguttaceae bacterium]